MLDFQKDISPIGGWLTKAEGEFLYKASLKAKQVVEIGSWKGRSTVCIASGLRDGIGGKVVAIDPHTGSSEHQKKFGVIDTYDEFLSNINQSGLDQFIIPKRMTSEEAEKEYSEQPGLVLVDGAHEYRLVSLDYRLWFPKLKEGGLMAFHDSWQTLGVHAFTTKLLLTSSAIRNPKLIDSLLVVEKVLRNTLSERVSNSLFVLYHLLFGWIGVIKIDHFGGTP